MNCQNVGEGHEASGIFSLVNQDADVNADRKKSVYLDTNVLANWLLLYRKGKKARLRAEKRAKECMRLLDRILKHRYVCTFLISPYALAELAQSARDNLIALKIIRDGQSLVWFNRLKKRYRLKNWEQAEIRASIDAFTDFLEKNKFVLADVRVHSREVSKLSLKYSLETHDAIHLSIARQRAGYLTTTDPDFLDVEPKIREVKVIRPSTLETIKELRRSSVR